MGANKGRVNKTCFVKADWFMMCNSISELFYFHQYPIWIREESFVMSVYGIPKHYFKNIQNTVQFLAQFIIQSIQLKCFASVAVACIQIFVQSSCRKSVFKFFVFHDLYELGFNQQKLKIIFLCIWKKCIFATLSPEVPEQSNLGVLFFYSSFLSLSLISDLFRLQSYNIKARKPNIIKIQFAGNQQYKNDICRL